MKGDGAEFFPWLYHRRQGWRSEQCYIRLRIRELAYGLPDQADGVTREAPVEIKRVRHDQRTFGAARDSRDGNFRDGSFCTALHPNPFLACYFMFTSQMFLLKSDAPKRRTSSSCQYDATTYWFAMAASQRLSIRLCTGVNMVTSSGTVRKGKRG